jgi:hypothetical protein
MHRARDRRPFWFFVAAMALALAGGGAIVMRARQGAADRARLTAPAPAQAPSR